MKHDSLNFFVASSILATPIDAAEWRCIIAGSFFLKQTGLQKPHIRLHTCIIPLFALCCACVFFQVHLGRAASCDSLGTSVKTLSDTIDFPPP